MTLNENDLAMLREMGRGFNGPETNFIAAVQRRLEALEERGVQVTRNHVRAASTPSWRGDDLCASKVGLTVAVRNGAGWRDAARRHAAP